MLIPALCQRDGWIMPGVRVARWLVVIGIAIVLFAAAGCAVVAPSPVDGVAANKLWEARRDRLAQLDQWQLSGRVAVRTADDGWNASIDWTQQDAAAWAIEFRGPFGQGAAAVRAAGGVVTMELPDRPIAAATDAETLLAAELGWTVPVSGLRYWILGVPVPGVAAQTELDNHGKLVTLTQAGWRAEYQRYKTVDGLMLPGKVTLTRDEVRLRFVIDAWRITRDPTEHRHGAA